MEEGSKNSRRYILAKWAGFVSAIWVQAIAGNNYGFSNYSVALKSIGGYNQVELNNLGVAKDVGKALGVVAGLASDFLPPWLILLIGSLDGLIGYGAQWLVLSRRIAPLPYWQMCVVLCMGGNSTTWMNTAVLVTSIRNFRYNRGPVVGILKGYIGLSTAIFTVLCSALFSNDPAKFVLLLAIIPFAVCIVAMIFLRPVAPASSKPEQEEERRGFFFLNSMATLLGVYLLFYDFLKFSGTIAAIFLLVLLLLPLYLPAKLLLLPRKSIPQDVEAPTGGNLDQPLLQQQQVQGEQPGQSSPPSIDKDDLAKNRGERIIHGSPKLGEDHNVLQLVKRYEFWLLFVSLLCGMGSGTVVINNLGQIGETLGYKDVGTFVSLTSVWGFFGRIGSGLVSEHFLRSSGVPRPVWLAASQVLMIVGFVLLVSALPGSLYIGSSITGLCYGVRLAVTVPTASELFGLKYFGLIYNILIINIPLGSFLFSGLLAGFLYDYEAQKSLGVVASAAPSISNPGLWNGLLQSFGPSGRACLGTRCYRLTYVTMIGICALGFIVDTVLAFVTVPLYRKLKNTFAIKSR
ncbi:protein NUCLEAR FUSION DEFECTIVE 4 [Selaginella moellendorffii]|uniref:protein NUCLEAR FUSION DEFECTIVE 4 n=1 Tax=Selaginella moellendorffii TaxID=88036 RepID=UPI000D1CD0B6|nr:protein NUCLEAR FUSION DEFECTIVE 4 [Selaginella moellendorffii]|eukprot:XP_024528344.1 protein NUCLEAR FUSION DEFECTIVE 4 [Selaginella moellendorffii]